jgi:DNA-binding SARP family transcriptional activator
MEFRLLGPLDVRGGTEPVELGGPRPRALLALLMLDAPAVVPAERLVDDLWGEAPPRSAPHLLHVYVSTLRKAFRAAEGRERLVTRAPGYVLEVEPEEIDARRFERLLGEGRRSLAAGDAAQASESLREALALWRGPALADFRYEPFAQGEIARLEELRVVAREERIEADLELGRGPELIGELEVLIAESPLRERPRTQLMLALYRSGRQAEALESYRETRRVLLDELGIEPWPSLKRLEQAILRQDVELEPTRHRERMPFPVARRLVTVLVADLGVDDGLPRLDAEARLSRLAEAFESVRAVLVQHGGTVERLPDERLLGVFGVPALHEDDALRGARAAVEMRELVDAGIGLETGEAIVDGFSVSGDVVARASRLSQAARPGEVLVGATGHKLIRHAARTEVDATRDGVLLVAVLPQASPLERRLDLPLVGRERELGQLRGEFDTALADQELRLVTVVGEAGVGKSRLAQEFVGLLGDRASVLVGRCVAYGQGVTYWPLREVVQQAAGDITHEALLAALASDEDREAVASLVAGAIGTADTAGTREESFWAFRRLFEELACKRPLLLVFEDVHWGEQTFLDLVAYLSEWTRGAPVLVLCLSRPELLEKRPSWPSAVTLGPLPRLEANRFLEQLPGGAGLPEGAQEKILEACGGNPLFLEQMLAMLAEETRSTEEPSLPVSLRAVLAARLDRLGPAERVVLERASLAGREIRPAALAALLPEDAHPSLDRHLAALVRKDFLRTEAGGLRFGHVLIQEATYRAIPKQLRASLHERLGDWLEHEGEGDELVGYHLERAFRLREELQELDWHARRLALRAAERLAAAGQRALGRDDPIAATNLLGRAASLVSEEESIRLDFLPDLVAALRELPDLVRAEATSEDAIAAAAAVGDSRAEALLQIERAHVRLMRAREGSVKEAFEDAERAIGVFEELGDELGLARAWRLIALANRLLGRQSARRLALERALVHVRRTDDRRTEAWIFDGLGGVHNYGPSPVQDLLGFADESLTWARASGQRFHEAHALAQGFGRAYAMLGDFESARHAIEEARSIVEDLGFVWHQAGFASAAGFVEMLAGDLQAAERELRAGYQLVERSQMTGSYFGMALREELAEALYAQGRYAEAKQLSEASERDAGADDVQAQVLWRAVRSKVLAREGRLEESGALARAAVALAEHTEFLLVHANACRDLGEVFHLAGRLGDARLALEEALRLYQQKGDLVSAKRMRAALAELEEELSAPARIGR